MQKILRRGIRTAVDHYQKQLFVNPASSHTSSKVDIIGNGFKPDSPVTIQGTLICPEEGLDFQSYAHVYTDSKGSFDMATAESLGGTYTGVDKMGLFWSMEKQRESYDRASLVNGSRRIPYTFSAFDNHLETFVNGNMVAEEKITRHILDENVTRTVVDEGDVKGTMFIPKGEGPFPVVISLLGGVKRRQVPEQHAAYLAGHGFITFTLQFFGAEGLPKSYLSAPIDIALFEKGIEFLRNHPSVVAGEIGVLGESKGGDIGLSMMTHLPHVKSVCTLNGSVSSIAVPTVYKGIQTDAISGDPGRVRFLDDGSADISDCLDHPKDNPKSMHLFEQSSADLLMIVGQDDLNWKSELMASLAKEKMDVYGKSNYCIQSYENIGHFIDPPNFPICTHDYHPVIPNKIKCFFGGSNKQLNSKEQDTVWQNVVEFFRDSLTKH